MYVRTYVCMYACMYVYMYMYVLCMYVLCTYVACMYVFMYVCVYTYTMVIQALINVTPQDKSRILLDLIEGDARSEICACKVCAHSGIYK